MSIDFRAIVVEVDLHSAKNYIENFQEWKWEHPSGQVYENF